MRKLCNRFILQLFFMIWVSTSVYSAVTEVDTTQSRDVSRIKKTTGEIIADIPGEILKLPFYALEEFTYAITTNPPLKQVLPLLSFGQVARPYVPVVGYSSNAGVKLGMGYKVQKIFDPSDYAQLKFYYSTNRYQSYRLKYLTERFLSSSTGLELILRYQKKTQESFYGMGNDSYRDEEANYTFERSKVLFTVPLSLTEKSTFALTGGYFAVNLFDGEEKDDPHDLTLLTSDPLYNLRDGHIDNTRYLHFGGTLKFDSRDNRGQPSSGNQIAVSFARFFGHDISKNNDFNTYSIDFRHYFEIWHKRLFALKLFVEHSDEPNAGERALPFYLTGSLGGVDRLRGYNRGRFLDNDVVIATMEYRYPVYDMIDAFVFWDEGRVYTDMTETAFFADWKYSYGFGIRLWNPDQVMALLQLARSKEATKVYLELGASW